jgi:hypothetical protein
MMYELGDYVYPTDLPRRFLCQVVGAESFHVSSGQAQILKLEPLEGPWPAGTCLIRVDRAVTPAPIRVPIRNLWQRRGLVRPPAGERPRVRRRVVGGRVA